MERYACNFLDLLSHPPLSKPLQRKLYLTCGGEERTPFALYIQPSITTPDSPRQNSPSLAFTALPAELQLHILTFCSAPTLFQFMRVSSRLRKEASKLFWAHPDAYFVIEAHWLLDGGGHAGYTRNNLSFLANVHNVQVDDNREIDWATCPMNRDGVFEARQDWIASFWDVLQKTCPSVKRVVINRAQGPGKGRNETHAVPRSIQLLVRASPPGIMASAFTVEQVDERGDTPSSSMDAIYASFPRWQRALYEPRPDGSWEKIKSHQDWKAVLAPEKAFSGFLGRFHKIQWTKLRLMQEADGLWFIMAKFLYYHSSDSAKEETLPCLYASCNASFRVAGEWSLHAAVMHNAPRSYQDWTHAEVYKQLSEEIRAEFEQRATTLTEKIQENDRCMEEIFDEWEQSSHEQQTEIRRLWMGQLENDPLWETGERNLRQNKLWVEFRCRFPYKGVEERVFGY